MSRPQNIFHSAIFRYKTIILITAIALAGYIIALPQSEPSDASTLTQTPTNTLTATGTMTRTATVTPTFTPTATASPVCSPLVLYDQMTDEGIGGSNSQDFEEVFDAFDNSNADDFVVPSGQTWTVNQVAAKGLYYNGLGQAQYFNVTFYHDEAAMPGAEVVGGSFVEATYTNDNGVFTITLPEELVLPSGTYWVAVQARMDYMPDGQWAWFNRTTTSNSPAVWHNPGGAFNIPICINYARRGETCGVDPVSPDHVFQILGTGGGAGCVTPTASPTQTETFTPTRTAASTATATVTPTGTPVHVSLPVLNAASGSTVSVPMSVSGMTGLGITSYAFQISFDPAIVQPAAPAFDQSGTLSSGMTITADTSNSGHLIVTASQQGNLSGSGTLLNLRFRFTPTGPSGASLSFQNYTDPGNVFHPAFRFNQGSPPVMTTNGFIFPPPTPTVTPSITTTPVATATATWTPTRTATATASPTPTCASDNFVNTTPIAINNNSAGSPYPSTITVAGLSGTVANVTADLTGLNQPWPDTIDIMLVGPGGQNTLLMSDTGGFNSVTNVDLQFDDGVPRALPDQTRIFSGAYGPSNYDTTTDVFPAPAPSPGVAVAMGVFNGTDPNGVWSLYVRTDSTGGFTGSISGGWRLHISTTAGCVATPTFTPTPSNATVQFSSATYITNEGQLAAITITRTGDLGGTNTVFFSTTGGTATGGTFCNFFNDYVIVSQQPVTFGPGDATKTVNVETCPDTATKGGETVDLGLSSPSTTLGTPSVAVLFINGTSPTNTATFTPTPAPTFTPTANVCPTAFSNSAPITINDNAAGAPYPSNIVVGGLSGLVTGVTVDLVDLAHTFPDDVDIMLVGPGGQNTLLMSDAGLGFDIVRTNLTFDDAVPIAMPDDTQISSGTFGPTNYDTTTDVFPAPAPTPGGPVAMGVFNGTDPNGTWSLYVRDDLGVDTGVIGAGWKLHITTTECSTPTGTPTPTATATNTATARMTETPGGFPSVYFDSPTYNENEPQTAVVTINRGGNPSIGAGANFSTSDATATGGTACTSGVDYISTSQQVSFLPNEFSKTVNVQICPDSIGEPTETIKLTLTGNYVNYSGTAVLNIINTATSTASISGRVMTSDGHGIRNAKVVITGNSLIEPLVATTGSFGYYSFENLETNQTYVVTVNSRRYTFSTPSRVISLVGNVTDADFIAEPLE